MSFSSISSILQSIQEASGPIRVVGTHLPTRAVLIAHLALTTVNSGEGHSPLVVVCSHDDVASDLCIYLESLLPIVCATRNSPDITKTISVLQFPTWDQSPFSSIHLSIRTRLARLATLSTLSQNKPPHIIVTSLAASYQATLPVSFFLQASLSLRVRESTESRESLIQKLVSNGYLRVDPVEDPGTFSVRGDIIDIFPPDREKPIRVELFGDEVDRIRDFDPATQRAMSAESSLHSSIFIPPAREVLIQERNASRMREEIKSRADDLGISRARRDPILEAVKIGHYPNHSDAWAPFAYAETSHFWNYLPKKSTIIWNDEFSCHEQWKAFVLKQEGFKKKNAHPEMIVPTFESLFLCSPELESTIRSKSKLFFDQIELTAPDQGAQQDGDQDYKKEIRHSVQIQSNQDLSRGSRQSLGALEPHFHLWIKQGFRIFILASTQSQLERVRFLLEGRGIPCHQNESLDSSRVTLKLGSLPEGFRWLTEGLVVLTEGEILGSKHVQKRKELAHAESGSAAKDWSGLQALSDLGVGDAIVHVDHGIGRYLGIVRLNLSGAPNDFLSLEYANKDKLYLPIYRLNIIQKYVGSGEGVTLDRLGSLQFSKTKEKVRESVKKLAFDLVQLYAQRKIQAGISFSPRDSEFTEFEANFPFDETPDQLKAINAVLSDMESGQVMDRLVCGDVGYGKTEVAIRAAFRAVSDGKQVAVLVPTTVLAQQHEISFKERLKKYPIIIESVSRFKSQKEQKALIETTAKGKVDIIIGTHRLLSRDVCFHDLGLIIVDEEHRFGVEHKERLKTLKTNTHVLTLTATPIPRTLHMALSGLREISLINTPPVDRLPIRTYVSKYDDSIVQQAIEFELSRGGQVFYLHNKVQTIHKVAQRIHELVPHARVSIAHGQLNEKQLEDTMLNFYQKKSNVLLCTTIIESGLDIPSANTILVDRADALGLSQLYQIRGRVGRGQQRAYAYLFIPPEGGLSDDAKQRLEVIQRFVELGSGFSIASHDLEIRGGGDLLGPQQSGSIAAVGFDLYTELLEEAIREIQSRPLLPNERHREPEIKAPFPSFLAEEYVPDVHQRLSLYRRFSASTHEDEITRLEEELQDRFGGLPLEAQNLMWLVRIKILLKKIGIDSLTVGTEKVSLLPGPDSQLDPLRVIALISAHPQSYQLKPDSKLTAVVPTKTLRDLYFGLESLFANLQVIVK